MELWDNYKRKNAASTFLKKTKRRKIIFEKYQLLLDSGMSYSEVTKVLLKRYEGIVTAESEFLRHVNDTIDNGDKFSDALKGWATPNEVLIVAAGESAAEDVDALEKCSSLMGKLIKMKATIVKSSIYPSFLMFALFIVIWGFSNEMLPILRELSDQSTWPSFVQDVAGFSEFVAENIIAIIISLAVLFKIISKSLSAWNHPIRNKLFDKIPPYSLYKEIQAGLFLVSLSTLLRSNVSFQEALNFIKEESPNYLVDKVEEIIDNIDEGMNEGKALNTDFIGDIGNDIEDFASGTSIEITMTRLGDNIVNDKIEKIEASAGLIKAFAMLSVFSYIICAYVSFISITQSLNVGS